MSVMAASSRSGRPPTKKLGDEFTQRLNRLRGYAQLTEAELAEWLGGISRNTVGSWSRGTRHPSWYLGDRMMKALDYLEKEMNRSSPRLPPPLGIRQVERLAYVREIRANYPAI